MSYTSSNTANFHEILEENLQQNGSRSDHFSSEKPASLYNAGWESLLDPAWMSQLLSLNSRYLAKPTPHRSYPRRPTPTVHRPDHVLTPDQKVAYDYFLQFSDKTLRLNFNLSELKSAYRKALLHTHPDQGGSAENFQITKKSYEILTELVKT